MELPRLTPAARPKSEAVAELLEHVSRQMQAASFSHGLWPTQWSILRYLARANPSACTLTAFAAFYNVTLSSAAQSIRLLIRKKLIRYERSTTDGRVRYLSLTAQGIALLAKDPLASIKNALRDLPDEQLQVFAIALGNLAQHMFTSATRRDGDGP